MIPRIRLLNQIKDSIARSPVTALLGPRQCGKTTLSKIIAQQEDAVYFDLEVPADRQALLSAPMFTLKSYNKLVIIDEIQQAPELFQVLRVLCDMENSRQKFLILGSASQYLIKNASETLAGRIAFVDMSGLGLNEVGNESLIPLWHKGGFPRSFLATDGVSFKWRCDFIRTFLERDIPQLGINIPSESVRRFWTMLAHYHGQVWNSAEFARSLSTTEHTARRYLDIMSGAFVVRQLQPWYENISKRQVKSPKVYIRDTGLLHALLILEGNQILSHPKLGSSWEGFILEQFSLLNQQPLFFWGTHAGAELDLMLMNKGQRIGVEIKYSDAPGLTKSMVVAIDDLKLHKLFVIYPGEKTYYLSDKVMVIPATLMSEITNNN